MSIFSDIWNTIKSAATGVAKEATEVADDTQYIAEEAAEKTKDITTDGAKTISKDL